MSAPNANPAPKGGLTAGQERATPLLALVPVFVLIAPSLFLLPGQLLISPILGGIVGLGWLNQFFKSLHGPVGWPDFIKFIAVADLAAWAAILLVSTLLAAAGWTETRSLGAVAGFCASCLIVWLASFLIFKVMIKRADDAANAGQARP